MAKKNDWSRFYLELCILFLSVGLAPAVAQSPPPAVGAAPPLPANLVSQTIKSVVDATDNPLLRWPHFPHYQDELRRLYEFQGYRPVWLSGAQPVKQVADVIEALKQAPGRGLDPADYDAGLIEKQWRELKAGTAYSEYERGLFDTAVSVGLMRYISDLRIGKINPRNINVGLNIEPKKYDLAALIRSAIANDRIAETIAAAEPQIPQYRLLKKALLDYERLAADRTLGPVPVTATVHPGESYAGLAQLRHLLSALGDLSASARLPKSNRFDGAIVAAVKRFQSRHGLSADGVIGKATFAALNVPLEHRVRQIEMALERLRWLPEIPEKTRFIVVNIPAFRLWAFDAMDQTMKPRISMNVVVGEAIDKHQTPVFAEDMRYLIFNPYWNVPYSITVREILPKLERNRGYLKAQNMEIVSSFGANARPLPVSAENIALLGSGVLKVRQRPGPKNALGSAKFIFPNNHNVYLHGTPQRSLFSRTRRDFSHGCIRVEDPVGLAEFVLSRKGGWDRAKILQAMKNDKTLQVNLDRPLPVLIFYTTVLAAPDGTVSFYQDVYGHDATLDRVLLAGYPYPP